MSDVAIEPCSSFEPDPEESELCFGCRWPSHFHAPVSPRPVSPRLEQPQDALTFTSPRSIGNRNSPRREASGPSRVLSGVWGAAKPSEEAVAKRSSGVLRQSSQLTSSGGGSGGGSSGNLPSGPPSRPLPTPASPADLRAPKEVAGLLRRMLKTATAEVDGVEYEGCFTASELVFALMQHRKWPRAECVEMGRVLLNGGFVARVGTVAQPGFVDSSEHYYTMIQLPEMASRGGRGSSSLEHGVVQWDQSPPSLLRPLDVRSTVATVIGSAWRFDYRLQQAYAVYFVHVMVGDEVFTVSRRFADVAELHRLLLRRYAARVLPTPPKERRGSGEADRDSNRAALQAHLVALVDCRFLAEEQEFVRFFRDMSADATPLLVGRSELVPLEEAFLLLGPSVRDVQMRERAVQRLRQEDAGSLVMYILFLVAALRHEPQPRSALLNFMLETAAQSNEFATLFFWHLSVEKLNNGMGPLANYELAHVLLLKAVSPELAEVLGIQEQVVQKLADTVSAVANSKVSLVLGCRSGLIWFPFFFFLMCQRDRPAKIERLREILGGSFGVSLRGISPPMLFPLCPELRTSGIDHATATLYKSNLLPLGLEWRVTRTPGAPREARAVDANISMRDGVLMKKTIFKKGDDLRQDQLVTTFVSIIASLLASAGLDLCMCVYRVLATGQNEGLIEVVPEAHNVSSVLEKFGTISMFLMHNNRHQASHTDALDSYIRSCAGYSIVTFFLGVGDRHLDNILVTNDGKIFHVDYGFILGRDPKPLPPAVRLTTEMIEGMGGLDSAGYQSYLTHCASAYRVLRRFSPLLLALFTLVCEGLPGIESAKDALSFLYGRLNLHLDDDQASELVKKTINDSAQLLFPQLMERLHKVTTFSLSLVVCSLTVPHIARLLRTNANNKIKERQSNFYSYFFAGCFFGDSQTFLCEPQSALWHSREQYLPLPQQASSVGLPHTLHGLASGSIGPSSSARTVALWASLIPESNGILSPHRFSSLSTASEFSVNELMGLSNVCRIMDTSSCLRLQRYVRTLK